METNLCTVYKQFAYLQGLSRIDGIEREKREKEKKRGGGRKRGRERKRDFHRVSYRVHWFSPIVHVFRG